MKTASSPRLSPRRRRAEAGRTTRRPTLRGISLLVAVLTLIPIAWATGAPQGNAEDYRIGPRDVLRVTVWGHDDLSKEYPVDAEGFVPFPLLGRVPAAGLTTNQLAGRLRDQLEKDFLVNPQVIVTVKEYLSTKVHVLGEADKPGPYYLTGPTTVLEILSKAGVAKTAGTQLVLERLRQPGDTAKSGNSTLLRLNIERVRAGDEDQNLLLQDEDTIFIPKANAFFVLGEVKRAGTFPFEKETSVLEAISLAGGFSDQAAPSAIQLIRRAADGKQVTLTLDLSGPIPKDRNFRLQDGDTLLVPKGNTFFVFGEVRKPGAYQLSKETNVLEGITLAGGLTDKAAPSRTRIIRNTPNGQEILNVDVNSLLKRGHGSNVLLLQENDVVVVPESFF